MQISKRGGEEMPSRKITIMLATMIGKHDAYPDINDSLGCAAYRGLNT